MEWSLYRCDTTVPTFWHTVASGADQAASTSGAVEQIALLTTAQPLSTPPYHHSDAPWPVGSTKRRPTSREVELTNARTSSTPPFHYSPHRGQRVAPNGVHVQGGGGHSQGAVQARLPHRGAARAGKGEACRCVVGKGVRKAGVRMRHGPHMLGGCRGESTEGVLGKLRRRFGGVAPCGQRQRQGLPQRLPQRQRLQAHQLGTCCTNLNSTEAWAGSSTCACGKRAQDRACLGFP